jgi:hypothetical protein
MQVCTNCEVEQPIDLFGKYKTNRNGKEIVRTRTECKSCRVKKEKIRSMNNVEKANSYKKKYKENNKEKVRESENNRVKNKRKNDPLYNIKEDIMRKTRFYLFEKQTNIDVGCSVDQFRKWFEYQFKGDMNWDDASWQCDHIIPLSFFDLTNKTEYKLASHWSNVRPINGNENRSKSNKIIESLILDHAKKLKEFLNITNQNSVETCYWQRVELWYGKNAQDDDNSNFKDYLKWLIRNEAPKGSENLPMGNAQRLNDSGSA